MTESLQPSPGPDASPAKSRRVLVVEDGPETFQPLVVIDIDELQADFKDVEWQDFIKRAVAHRRRLREAGLLH